MDLILGVDGGQSSTIALLATLQGQIVGVGHGGPANHIHEPGGVQRMEQSLRDAVNSAFANAHVKNDPIRAACFGMTGGMDLVPEIAARILQTDHLIVHHDVVTALAGASGGKPGLLVISGTGAIAYGRTSDGREARADGAGYLMGDEGSGYWIGVQALRAIARAHDGRGPATRLSTHVPHALGLTVFADVHQVVYSQSLDRPGIAALAFVVLRQAQEGDTVAATIVEEAGNRLAESVLAVLNQLPTLEPAIYPSGGILQDGSPVLDSFRKSLLSVAPQVRLVIPAYPQVVGALLLARTETIAPVDSAFYQELNLSLPPEIAHKRPN